MLTLVYPENGLLEHFIPLGICYIGSYLQCRGVRVNVLDMRYHKYSDLKNAAKTSEFIGFSVMTIHLERALSYAEKCKEINPKIKIVFGGPHPTIFPEQVLKNSCVDFVVIGEGEETMHELMLKSSTPELVEGIAYRKGRKIIFNKQRKYIADLDKLPFADRDLFPIKAILKKTPYWPCLTPYPQLSMISTRGCPYNCVYCQPTLRKIYGNETRRRSPLRTVDEMEFLFRKYQPASIFMADDLFTADKKWTIEVCREIRRRNLHKKLIWECESRVNTFDSQVANELKKSGCYMVWFGTESYCQNTLNVLRKGTTTEQNKEAIELCKKYKLMSMEQLMVGSPRETKEGLYDTLRLSKKYGADIAAVAVTSPVPGTDLYDLLVKDKLILTQSMIDLGSRFKGKQKFHLLYPEKDRDFVYDQLKIRGEISMKYILTRDYYRNVFFRRLKSHVRTGNFKALLIDWGRVFYRMVPDFSRRFFDRLVLYVKVVTLR